MPMVPFMTRFPELGARETRNLIVSNEPRLPDGEYGFVELYCNEPRCDCRRVAISVMRPETGGTKIWASISDGWESLEYYQKWGWSGGDPEEVTGPYLDPLNAQTEYAPVLLHLFRSLIESPEYVDRLKRHYRMFRDSVDQPLRARLAAEDSRLTNRRKRLRDPRRR